MMTDSAQASRETSPIRKNNTILSAAERKERLNGIFQQMSRTILKFQSPTSGLFPQTTDDCKVADVRTTIYCALSTWALHLAYRKILSDDGGRTHLLSQTAVKAMRGILRCWMYQIPKLRQFTSEQIPENALHVRFDLITGQVLHNDNGYHHLQLDVISLYLLSLVQMIASGLQIIYTFDEVDFIQNLVFCIERAYRIADYGMWERGSKYNNGTPELNASSVGMAKAAMEAVNGFNLFGEHGASWTVIYVDIDAHMRNRVVFENLIPRESSSKLTDAALLPALSWPCFALHDTYNKDTAITTIIQSLKGRYGMKRFNRDGYGTVFEDKNRKYYDASEIKEFDGVESEWPFLVFFLIIDKIFSGEHECARTMFQELSLYLPSSDYDGHLVPKYYYVQRDHVQRERENPGTSIRRSSGENEADEEYFLWGQSVYLVMKLLLDNLLPVNDLDPIKRYLSASERPRVSHRYMSFEASQRDRIIQVSIIAESVRLQQALATHGILSQTPAQVEPIQIWSPNQLMKALKFMGVNTRLGLEGRPSRPVGHIGTSMFYRVCGQTIISYPLLFELNDFYISQDLNSVIDEVQYDLMILSNTWKLSGRPTYIIMVTEAMVLSPHTKDLINMLSSFKTGVTSNGVQVKQHRLQSMVSSGTKEHLDFLSHCDEDKSPESKDLEFEKIKEMTPDEVQEIRLNLGGTCPYKKPVNIDDVDTYADWKLVELYRSTDDVNLKSQSLRVLMERHGQYHNVDGVPIHNLLEKIRIKATNTACQDWKVVRLCSALTGKVVDSLAPSITTMLVRGKVVTVGVFGHEERVISKPINPGSLGSLLYDLCLKVNPCETCLQQELILIIGRLHSTRPELFDGILKIRIGWIIHALQYALSYEYNDLSVFSLSPSEVNKLLTKILENTKEPEVQKSMLWRRRLLGSLGALPKNFYEKIWAILERTPGGIKLQNYHLPQQPTLSDLTVQEMNFALLIDEMLCVIGDPILRQIVVEILTMVAVILDRNPEVNFEGSVDVNRILEVVFSDFKKSQLSNHATDEEVKEAFCKTLSKGTHGTYSYIAKAICSILLDGRLQVDSYDHCNVM